MTASDVQKPKSSPVEAAFAAPEGTSWNRVDPAFTWYRRLLALMVAVPVAVLGGAGLGVRLNWGAGAALAVLALLAGAAVWFVAGRTRESWGYAEGRSDFYLTFGTVIRQLVVVPYGRMQVVDVTANLLEQSLGIATVRVRTAATTADARIPGLSLQDATALRDRLAARSETFSTGL
ncbi:PH domain-containing protein [Actinorugispora endophytica]|uniref:YdbS-like PH domain-containing protein n=1 Tax=Actinorugispora endophytica TaxID=1605990 RepID=A0A4R6V7Y1_9ACTN|nr:PH domain-containing protein [Actinorugispora endophytica]TDQ55219.1 hypothetical protein EV190_101544 [Actinorugispora endophytica]